MNRNRILVGGLIAGLVMNLIGYLVEILLVGDRYAQLQERGAFLAEPRYGFFIPVWIIFVLAVGIALTWLYAVARPRLGAGPKTAIWIGLVVGLVAYVPVNFAEATWSVVGRGVPLIWMCGGILQTIVGTLVGGALYKEA